MDKISLFRDNAHIDPNAQRNIGLEISFIGIFHATTKVAYTFPNLCGYTKSLKCLKFEVPKVNLSCLFYKPDLGQNQIKQFFGAYFLILGTSNFRHLLRRKGVRFKETGRYAAYLRRWLLSN